MSQFYNITQYQAGKPWKSPYGMLDSFFLDIEGFDGATIMTNKKEGNTPKLGQVYGELIFKKKGAKGQDVYQFKQLEQPEGVDAPATSAPVAQPTQTATGMPEWFAPYAVMIKNIHDDIATPMITIGNPAEPDAVEEIESPKLSKSELEDIFGGSMEPIELVD